MSCGTCEHFSKRGTHVDGVFVQGKDSRGNKTGWCQYNPPVNLKGVLNNWPTVSTDEYCGHYKETYTPSCYRRWYSEAARTCEQQKSQLLQRKELHKAVGELGPLVGKKTNSVRLKIVTAVKEALIQNQKQGE